MSQLPLGQQVLKVAWKSCVLSCCQKKLNALDLRSELGREFQMAGVDTCTCYMERKRAKIRLGD